MIKVTQVKAKAGYTLALTFSDDLQGDVCIADSLFGAMFEPLKDQQFFSKVAVDAYGVVCWPNEADLDTEVLHQKVLKQHN